MSPRRAVVFVLPILGLSIISCGGDSGLSSQASEAEFCAMLQAIESDQVFENAMEDPEASAEATKLLTDLAEAARSAEVVFLCVPTPQGADGSADLSFVQAAARSLAELLQPGAVVVNKSTVPVGSIKIVEQELQRPDVFVVSNPEFLREGTAIYDFLHPDRIVVGADDREIGERVCALYAGIEAPMIITDPASAETIKYAANAFLAFGLFILADRPVVSPKLIFLIFLV